MSTRRALAFSFLDRYAGLVLTIAASMFIARLLTPAEIGVYSVTMVLLTFISTLRDFGAGQYLVQEKELTRERIRATWTVLLGTGMTFAIVVALAAKPVSAFYGDPRMFDILLVVSLNFAINPFGSLTYAWLMREMRFEALAMMRFASGLAGAGTSVLLAWQGVGPLSLAYGSLAATVVNAVFAARYRPQDFPWLPGRSGLRRVVAFGGRLSATSLINNIASSAPELLLGKLRSLTEAAYYSRANGLAMMFQRLVLDATQAVAMPMFAKESREKGSIAESFMLALSYITALGWAFFAGLALLAHPSIRLLYGDQWDSAVTATRWLAIAFSLGLPAALCTTALMAVGAVAVLLRITFVTVIVHVVLVGATANSGVDAVALGVVAAQAIGVVVWLSYTRQAVAFRWIAMLKALCKSALVAAITALAPLLAIMLYGWEPASPWPSLLLSSVGGCVLFVGAVIVVGHPLQREVDKLRQHFSPA